MCTVSADRPDSELTEIEITPEMIEAGEAVIDRLHETGTPRVVAEEVYRAMARLASTVVSGHPEGGSE